MPLDRALGGTLSGETVDPVDTALAPVINRESGGKPYVGTGGRDLSSYIESGDVTPHGFPNWAGIQTDKGKSTAAGLYQITRTNWEHYAPLVGVSDFSPESQRKVAHAMYREAGLAPWSESSGTAVRSAPRRAPDAEIADDDMKEPDEQQKEIDRLKVKFARMAASAAPTEAVEPAKAPDRPAAQPAPAAPLVAAQHFAVPSTQVTTPPIPKAPMLAQAYRSALGRILAGRPRPFANILG